MFEKACIMGLYAETPLHPGSGSTTGVIDLPVQRERHTNLPLIPGSSLKGVFRDLAEKKSTVSEQQIKDVFGPTGGDGHGGALAFTDARLLLFPIRSLEGIFVWGTCPFILDRLRRDLETAKKEDLTITIPEIKVENNEARCAGKMQNPLILEEFDFEVKADKEDEGVNKLATELAFFFPEDASYNSYKTRLKTNLVVLSDTDFRHMVTTATEVVTRIKLNEKKTTTGGDSNMWIEEYIPSDALFYALGLAMPPRSENCDLKDATGIINFLTNSKTFAPPLIQIGADETVGRGWMRLRYLGEEAAS